jgi:hypothetical protein
LYAEYVNDLFSIFAQQATQLPVKSKPINAIQLQDLITKVLQASKDPENQSGPQITALRNYAQGKTLLNKPLKAYSPEKIDTKYWRDFRPAADNPRDLRVGKSGYTLEDFLKLYREWKRQVEAGE